MTSRIQILRSDKTQERPVPGNLLDGQPAVNFNANEPGLFFKTSDGDLVKIGPAAITSDGNPPNAEATGSIGNAKGELWLDKSVTPPVLKIYDGTRWVNAGSGGSGGDVNSVNGQVGTVVLTAGDVDAYTKAEVDNLIPSPSPSLSTVDEDFKNLYNVNADRVNSKRDAAQFLRQATLGPTSSELDDLVKLGSKRAWLIDQMASSFDNSPYAEFVIGPDPDSTETNPPSIYRYPDKGWFGGVMLHLNYPENPSPSAPDPTFDPKFINWHWTGLALGDRMIQTAFIRNNPAKGGIGSVVITEPGGSGVGTIPEGGQTFSETTPVINNAQTGGVDVTPADRKAPRKSFLCKTTWILSKVFPASIPGGGFVDNIHNGIPLMGWLSSLSRYAFTTWSEILEEVTYSTAMSLHLTHLRNQKDDGSGRQPDENFAREIMQLFSIGLFELNLDGTQVLDEEGQPILNYTNDDIYQLSRAFTGLTDWTLPDTDYTNADPEVEKLMLRNPNFSLAREIINDSEYLGCEKPVTVIKAGERYEITIFGTTTNWEQLGAESPSVGTRFVAISDGNENFGDGKVKEVRERKAGNVPRLKHYIPWYETGSKQLLEKKGQSGQYHIDIPENTDPETNIRMVIDGLVNHPNCAPNIALMLIRFSTTSNPSPGYVSRVASVFRDNGKGVVGHMPSVWTAIFTDPEASLDSDSSVRKGRIKDGFEIWAGLVRSTDRQNAIPYEPSPNRTTNKAVNMFVDGEVQQELQFGVIGTEFQPGGGVGYLGAYPAQAPSIFGFYPQDYTVTPAAEWGIIVPELSSLSSTKLFKATKALYDFSITKTWIGLDNGSNTQYDTRLIDHKLAFPSFGASLDVSDLVDEIDLKLCGGTLDFNKKTKMVSVLETMPKSDLAEISRVIAMALQLTIYCPEFWIA